MNHQSLFTSPCLYGLMANGNCLLLVDVYFDFERITIDSYTAMDYRFWNINNTVGAKSYNPNINKMLDIPWRYQTVRTWALKIICK